MKAKCPQCGLLYPHGFTYCKKDGARLVRGRRLWPYLVVAAFMVVGLAGAYAIRVAPHYIREHLVVRANLAEVHFQGGQPVSNLVIHITNSTRVPASLRSLSSVCSVSGTDAATVEWTPESDGGLSIPGNGTTEVTAKVHLKRLGWRDIVRTAAGSGKFNCHGPMRIAVLGVGMTRNLSYSLQLW